MNGSYESMDTRIGLAITLKILINATKTPANFSTQPFLLLQVWRINVNDFLDVLLSDPGPDCLTWLPLLYRLAQSESGKILTNFIVFVV